MVPPDPEGGVSEVQFAIVYEPKRGKEKQKTSKRKNKRFSANCVELKENEESAIQAADASAFRYPAKVLGPSKSSEGQFIFYLVEWLEF